MFTNREHVFGVRRFECDVGLYFGFGGKLKALSEGA